MGKNFSVTTASEDAVESFQPSSQQTLRFLIPELQRQEGDSVRISRTWDYTSVRFKDTDLKRGASACHITTFVCPVTLRFFEISLGLIHAIVF